MIRRFCSLAAAAAAALALSACGGGGGEPDPQPVSPQPQPQKGPTVTKTYRIEMYGDSTTRGVDGTDGQVHATTSEPTVLAGLLTARYDPAVKQVQVANEGVPGTSAYNLLYGSDGVHVAWAQLMASSTAQMVILNFGMNDSSTLNSVSLADYQYQMGQLIDIARAAGKFVVLQQPNPSCTADHVNLGDYVRALDGVGRAKSVPVVEQYWKTLELVPRFQGIDPNVSIPCFNLPNLYIPDGIHPNEALYSFKASNTFNLIAPVVDAF